MAAPEVMDSDKLQRKRQNVRRALKETGAQERLAVDNADGTTTVFQTSAEVAVALAEAFQPERKQTLLDLVNHIEQLAELIEDAENDEERAVAQAEQERVVSTDLKQKIDAIGWFKKRTEQQVEALKAAKREFCEDIERGIRRLDARWERVRELSHYALKRTGERKFKGSMYTLSACPGRESLEIVNELEIPDDYKLVRFCLSAAAWAEMERLIPPPMLAGVRITTEVDEAAVRAALQAKQEVPGARMKAGDEYVRVS